METIRERLEEDLRTAVGRLRMIGGAVAVEELAGAIGDNSPYADEVDEIQENERREIGFATGAAAGAAGRSRAERRKRARSVAGSSPRT